MNLLGLLLGQLMERSLNDPRKRARLSSLRGEILVQAGRMKALVTFSEKDIFIERFGGEGKGEGPLHTRVKGTIPCLMALGSGRIPLLSLLRGELTFRGNPLLLLRFALAIRPSPGP